jgi:drug/metabolite transporter (DMT)-like permease
MLFADTRVDYRERSDPWKCACTGAPTCSRIIPEHSDRAVATPPAAHEVETTPLLIIPGGTASPMTETNAVATVPRRFTLDTQTETWGYFCGCVLALGASLSFATARAGIINGLTPSDLILMRFSVAGVVLLPLLLRWGLPTLAGIGWRRGLILTVLGGPAFALKQMGGYAFAPLAHGAVIHPASVTILSTGIAAALLGERLSRGHLIGAGLVIGGIVLISWQGLHAATGVGSWVGDLLFFASAVLWAGFTVLIRHWRLPAIRVIAVVSVLSLLVVLPSYLAWYGLEHLRARPPLPMAMQALVQGLLQGIVALTAYSQAIRVLGVSRAVLFPAMVPGISILIGIPIVGEVPNATQVIGLLLVTIGLVCAIGTFRWIAVWRRL